MLQTYEDNGIALFNEASTADICSLLKGFETLRNYVPRMLPLKASKKMLEDFKGFIDSIPIEYEEEKSEPSS